MYGRHPPDSMIRRVIRDVSAGLGIQEEDLVSHPKQWGDRFSPARACLFWLLREFGYSYAGIGRRLGFDHTSVRTAHKKFKAKLLLADLPTIRLASKVLEQATGSAEWNS